MDYYSKFPKVIQLKSAKSQSVIIALKATFVSNGIPETLMSDNSTPFTGAKFNHFANTYGFEHLTSSPHYPRSNDLIERMVKTVNKLLKGAVDPYLSLLSYWTTPLPWCGLSPTELSQGRRIRSDVSQTKRMLEPHWPHLQEFRECDREFKMK